jgi:hypothetical protein
MGRKDTRMKKKIYIQPEIQIIHYETERIIAGSANSSTENYEDGGELTYVTGNESIMNNA